jgi:ketosteroid isomerase-like protein
MMGLAGRSETTERGRSMAHANEEFGRKVSGALAKGDLETFFGMHADDVKAHIPFGDTSGKDDFRQSFDRLFSQLDGPPEVDVHDALGSDEHAVILATQRFTKGGKTFDSRNTVVMHVRDGKVAEVWVQSHDPQGLQKFLQS